MSLFIVIASIKARKFSRQSVCKNLDTVTVVFATVERDAFCNCLSIRLEVNEDEEEEEVDDDEAEEEEDDANGCTLGLKYMTWPKPVIKT